MPLKKYGVLKGSAVDRRLGAGQSPHYQVRLVAGGADYRIAINVQSKLAPSELDRVLTFLARSQGKQLLVKCS